MVLLLVLEILIIGMIILDDALTKQLKFKILIL
jgi:hypothetical protein